MTQRPDILDSILVAGFLIGIYLSLEVSLGGGVPIPALSAAAASGLLLLRHMNWIEERHLTALLLVLLLYLLSIFFAPDYAFFTERFKGFIQLAYSFVAGYGFFIVATRYDRAALARIFLILCLLILAGTALENYTAFKTVSDSFRERFYDFGVYASDRRDELLYGMIRPKFFTSEPSYLTFGFSFLLFGWYGLSTAKLRLPLALALLAAAYFLMRGPTLLLVLPLIAACELLLNARKAEGAGSASMRLVALPALALFLLGVGLWAGASLFAERLDAVLLGSDPSFFYREIGPALTALATIAKHPFTGIGLTGEEYLGNDIVAIYMSSPAFSPDWATDDVAHIITNYFWSHWIYFGLGWGLALVAAFSWFLKRLDVPSVTFCWVAWIVFGQSMGAYVSPRTWSVMFLASVIAILSKRQPVGRRQGADAPQMRETGWTAREATT